MKKKTNTFKLSIILTLLLAFFATQNSWAAAIAAGASGNWADGSTWVGGNVPGSGDAVTIGAFTVTLNQDATITSLTLSTATSVLKPSTSEVTLTVAGNVTQSNAGALLDYQNGAGRLNLIISAASTITLASNPSSGVGGAGININNLTINAATAITNNWLMAVHGNMTLTAALTSTVATDGGVEMAGTGAASITGAVNCGGLMVNKTDNSTVTAGVGAALTLTQNLNIARGTLAVGDNNLSVAGTTTVAAGATLDANYTVSTVTRVFTGTTALTGTLNSSGPRSTTNNTFTGAVTFAATGIMNVANSETLISNAPVFGVGSSIVATGAKLTYAGGALSFTGVTISTNSNTDLVLSATAAISAFPSSVTDLHSLNVTTINGPTLTANLTVAQNVTINLAGGLTVGANTLTVNGAFTNGAAGAVIANGSTLILNGPSTTTGGITSDNTTSITFGGSGTITTFPGAAAAFNNVTYNRTGVNTTLTAHVLTISGDLTISAGTLTASVNSQFVIATGTTTIGAAGTLDMVTFFNSFASTVTGTGTLDIDQVGTTGMVFAGPYSFTGNLKTSSLTFLSFIPTVPSDVILNSSVTDVNTLTFNSAAMTLTLNNNLTITAAATATTLVAGTLDVNGYTLTFSAAYADAGAAFTLKATNSSLVFVGAAVFAAGTYTIDETTNLEFGAGPTLVAAIVKCKNLTIRAGAITVTQLAAMDIYGNLDIGVGAAYTKVTFDLTVRGDVSNAGTLTLSGAGGNTYFYGQVQGAGTYTTAATAGTTNLHILGTSSQFIMPVGITSCENLTLNRPSGMKLNAALTIGAAAATGKVTITNGDLDLNGYILTLARTGGNATLISETAGNTVINSGNTTTGYILQAASTAANDITSSGIGITVLTGPTVATVRRYPITVPVPGVGLSTSRVFYIVNDAAISAVTFQFDNTELYSSASDLKLYMSTVENFGTKTNVSDVTNVTTTVSENTPSAGFGRVAMAGGGLVGSLTAATRYYALASVPGNGGVMYTYAGADNGYWGTSTNWTPNGVPSKVDQVVIGPNTVVLNGEGLIFECKTLQLNHANATLKPYDNTLTGDNVSLLVNGNITLVAGAEILGVNGKGRINLIIGDGVTAGVSSTISGNADYVPTAGIWLNNLTVNMADVTFPANFVRISGDVSLLSNCAVSGVNAEFWGGANALQTITIPNSSDFVFAKARFDNNAKVTTPSNFTLTDNFLVKSGSQFNATNGTALFTTPVANTGDPWNVENGGTLKFWNVEFNASAGLQTFAPLGTAYVQGNFYQYGTDDFLPTSGTVIFQNTGQKEIVNTQATTDLVFYNLQVAAGSKVVTSNSLNVAKEIDVKVNASLIAENGTIQMIGTSPLYIKNASTHTLEFNNLTITNTTYTSDSWTIKGDLLTTQALIADKGTITFENVQLKTITPTVAPTFFKLLVADGSKLTTAANHDFTIANNATNPTGAGIEVAGSGEFYVGAATSVITFDAGVGMTSGNPKMITKSSAGRLDFGLITIAASPNNEVATASDFKVTGATFNNNGAGGKFTASAGTVTFAKTAVINSVSPAVTQFYSVKAIDLAAITLTDAQEIYIAGDMTLDGQSSFAPVGTNSKVIFNGGTLQTIGGNSAALLPISFADVVINKANNSELLLGINATINSNIAHELTLSNGILNLGSKTLTSGAGIISRANGAINGGTGTYIISTNHALPKLEDVYFTIGGVPTLYNLTVNAAHTTANDLTVNGTLNLNTANLQIGAGASASSPIKLIANGNVTRTAGIFAGSPTLSRLVLQGTGTVDNGLSNTYFGGTNTTVQLEIARGEVLGGNLNIVAASYLRMNTGINNFDLGTNTLTFDATSFLTMISGGIKAGTGSKVDLTTSITTVPASMFRNNECYNLTTAADLTLAGDLTINGTLSGVFQITTNENTLTFGPSATLPVYTDADHIKGNVRRTVTSTATVYPIGNGTALMPVTLKFANGGSEQLVTSSIKEINPVYGRGGNANNAVELEWNFLTEGTAPMDSVNAIFTWVNTVPNPFDGGTTPLPNTSFPAKWMQTYWSDYRTKINTFTAPSPRVITMASYPLQSSSDLTGTWAIFTATANTDVAKDAAIANTKNKVVIKSINPTPVLANNAFKITVELQDPFGRAISIATPFGFTISKTQGGGTFAGTSGIIPAGQSSVTLSGLVFTLAGINNQLLVDTSAASANWNPGLSNTFSVLPVLPATQASAIVFSNVDATSMKIDWTTGLGANELVVVKADTLLSESEYPVGGTSYYANTIMGAGSSMGSASVVYNGGGTTTDVTGLSSNTTYYVYVFSYDGVNGGERYRTTAASGNPKSTITTGSYDDDLTLGTNNTRETSKTIGTNTPVSGTIKTADDIDWFNFTVTSASPNIRGTLVLTSDMGNYDLELYNMDGRRIRRGIRVSNNTEAQVINDLPAGTYTVKVMAIGGAYSATSPYKLKVTTSNNEIFSVTP